MKRSIILFFLLMLILVSGVLPQAASASQTGWQYDSHGWWYLYDDGSYPADTWELIDGSWYCFDEEGFIRTGWVSDGGSWYYLYSDGWLASGWIWDNAWYYMSEDGSMVTGWLYDHESWYYFDNSGKMVSGSAVIDGETYYFSESGVLADPDINAILPENIPAGTILSEQEVAQADEDAFFYVEEISDETFARMWGKSFKEDCTVPREDLRYIRCLHRDYYGNIKVGELVMHRDVADTVCQIFKELYMAEYPIESMLLVDEFDASDDDSIMANNTSAFNYRTVEWSDQLSMHAYGLAIDINPYYNVYYIPEDEYVFPYDGWLFTDRDADFPYKLEPYDLCYELFTQAGFDWGGWWAEAIDYQHFQYIF